MDNKQGKKQCIELDKKQDKKQCIELDKKQEKKRFKMFDWYFKLSWLGNGLLIVILAVTFGSASFTPSASMEPTLKELDYVYFINSSEFKRGDIVTFTPSCEGINCEAKCGITEDVKELSKRIIAVGGDVVEIRAGVLYINGEVVNEPYVKEEWFDTLPEFTVPDDHVYIMGDNRNESSDSRCFGNVPIENVSAKALFRLIPRKDVGFKVE